MKKTIFTLLLFLLFAMQTFAQQAKAKEVLDKTAANFRQSKGIKAEFEIKSFSKGHLAGQTSGVIHMKSEKFLLKTSESTIWFDGKTMWSYLSGSEEVNVSNPTAKELHGINPYIILALYKNGFSFKPGETKIFRGKQIHEVLLTGTDGNKNQTKVVLYITKDSYEPLYIVVKQRDGSRSEITVTGYHTGQKYADSLFVFNKKQYPNTEIIDLR